MALTIKNRIVERVVDGWVVCRPARFQPLNVIRNRIIMALFR